METLPSLPTLGTNCPAIIGFGACVKGEYTGRGFGRRYVQTYVCPVCRTERKLVVRGRCNGRPSTGPGAFVCGAYIPARPI